MVTSELKVGNLIWWKRTSTWDPCNTPCVVTRVSKYNFRVLCLDDFKECGPISIVDCMGGLPSSLRQMRTCSMGEVEKYLDDQILEREGAVRQARKSLAKKKRELASFRKKAKDALKKAKTLTQKTHS